MNAALYRLLATYPVWEIDLALFRNELQYTSVCRLTIFFAVYQLEEHGICDVQAGELVESTGRKEHFAAVVCFFALRTRQHDDGIAAEILVEPSWSATAPHSLVHGHRVVFVVEAGVELREVSLVVVEVVGSFLPCWETRLCVWKVQK